MFLKTAEITEAGVKRVLKLTTNVNNEIADMFTGNVFRWNLFTRTYFGVAVNTALVIPSEFNHKFVITYA